MRKSLAAFAALALASAPLVASAEGQGKAEKSTAQSYSRGIAAGKDKPQESAGPGRSNKGGETRGKARADEVRQLNQQKKPGG